MIALVLVLGVVASIVAHEAAHAIVARHLGWDFVGLKIQSWKLVGVQVKTTEKHIASSAWIAALAGPLANIALGDACLAVGTPVFTALGYFNFAVAIINLLPIPGSDGSVILRSLREEIE